MGAGDAFLRIQNFFFIKTSLSCFPLGLGLAERGNKKVEVNHTANGSSVHFSTETYGSTIELKFIFEFRLILLFPLHFGPSLVKE